MIFSREKQSGQGRMMRQSLIRNSFSQCGEYIHGTQGMGVLSWIFAVNDCGCSPDGGWF